MKKWMKWFCANLIALVAVLCTSCHRPNYDPAEVNKEDVSFVKATLQQIDNPTFTNVENVVEYQNTSGRERYLDSVFYSIPQDVLKDVAQVLINRRAELTKHSIAEEYIYGKKIYTNLPDQYRCRDDNGDDTTKVDNQN